MTKEETEEIVTVKVEDLSEELTYIPHQNEIEHILSLVQNELEQKGLIHDTESIILEDSFASLWVDVEQGDYVEVWGCHYDTPHLNDTAYKIL